MSDSRQLKILPPGADRKLTPEQKRFNSLIRQIEQARATLQAWQESLAEFRVGYQEVVLPLRTELRSVLRQWVLALDAAMSQPGWGRADRDTAGELIEGTVTELLEAGEDDAELQAVYKRHAGIGFDEARQESLDLMRDMAEEITGLDFGDEDVKSEDELLRRMHEQMEAATQAKAGPKARARKTAAQQRREQERQRTTQSVREVYRKLASALHPDREPDPERRASKNALMARVNEAYERSDLLALLELQLQIEQIDADHLANVDTGRLKHYNKVLYEQLIELRMEARDVALGVAMDFDVELEEDPKNLRKLLEQEQRRLRASLAESRREVGLFADAAATRRWLKKQRRLAREAEEDDDLGFFF